MKVMTYYGMTFALEKKISINRRSFVVSLDVEVSGSLES